MEINSTILVQFINFIIAYIVLRQFLFKPIVAVIQQETGEREALISLVEARGMIVRQKEQDNKESWRAHQHEFASIIPVSSAQELVVFKDIDASLSSHMISQETIDQAVQQTVTALVDKVEHGSV